MGGTDVGRQRSWNEGIQDGYKGGKPADESMTHKSNKSLAVAWSKMPVLMGSSSALNMLEL